MQLQVEQRGSIWVSDAMVLDTKGVGLPVEDFIVFDQTTAAGGAGGGAGSE